MHLLTLCYEYPPLGGGGGQVVYGLSKQLVATGSRVDLVTMRYRDLPRFEKRGNLSIRRVPCIRHGPIICHPHEMMSYICMALPIVMRMARENSYDIIHAHFIFPDGILAHIASMLTGTPYLITSHGSDVPGYNPDRFVLLHRMFRPLWKRVVRRASRIICITRFLENLVKQAMLEAKTVIIPNGFFPGRFRTGKQKRNRILIVSRMFKRKGIQHFLKAIEGLPLDYEIHIVGDGPYLWELKRLAKALTTPVIFHGFLKNNSQQFSNLMESSKIFVFPSESDNFPMVLLEAMDAGMGIITTKGTGCEEVVGNAALLTAPGDVVELRSALVKYIEDPLMRARLGERAQRRLDENFSWEVVAKKYVGIYQNILESSSFPR